MGLAVVDKGFAQELSLKTYLEQVAEVHNGLKAAQLRAEAALLRKNESLRDIFPQLFSEVEWMSDRSPTTSAAFQGTKTSLQNYRLGLQQQSVLGTSWQLFYGLNSTKISGTDPN